MARKNDLAFVGAAFLCILIGVPSAAPRFLALSDVQKVLDRLSDLVPAELRSTDIVTRTRNWDRWIAGHDLAIRTRLEQGDLDTVINWLLFGTTFTAQPRVALGTPADSAALDQLVAHRARDLVAALVMPGADERKVFARRLLEKRGLTFATATGRDDAEHFLLAEVRRVLDESRRYALELERDRRLGDATADLAARSKLFRDRGLSLDTSLLPSFALEQTLAQMKAQGALAERSLAHVGIIGPGLDFTDKNAGYDIYPQQTMQPFALVDALRRLKLAPASGQVDVVTFDLSPRVNEHLRQVRDGGAGCDRYALHLLLDTGVPWMPEFVSYWRQVGATIGTPVDERTPAGLPGSVRARTVRARRDVCAHIVPVDLNIVTQRDEALNLDLLIATNVLVYYDTLDQSLALSNIASMLRPNGFLLSNNALLELPEIPMQSAGYTTVVYSARRDDGDHIVWYRRRQ